MNCEDLSAADQWVVMFPGQGSQFVGMGKDFYAESAACREIFDRANDLAEKDITKLCFSGPVSKLSNTDNLQIAMTATNLAIANYLFSHTSITPSVVLGHSVGEYSALQMAGCLSIEDALRASLARGRLMQREAKAKKGQMYAVKDLAPSALSSILENITSPNAVVIANDNSPSQQVISGEKSAMSALLTYFSENNIESVKLPVSGAWHSMLMQGCVEEFYQTLADIDLKAPKITYINNMTAQTCTDVVEIKEHLVSHITGMVRWRESIEYLLNKGHKKFIEVGPKKVLSRLLESIAADTSGLTIEHVESLSDAQRIGG